MSNEQKTHFAKQNDAEKKSKLQLAQNLGSTILLWKKGAKERYSFKIKKVDRDNLLLFLDKSCLDSHKIKNVLYSFTLSGLSFFGKASITSSADQAVVLNYKDDLFKCERRLNFRLLTFPHYQTYVHLPIELDERTSSNVVSFQTGVSETGLFKNFLHILGESDDELFHEGYLKFRVLDLSVTGLSFKIGQVEKEIIEKSGLLKSVYLELDGREILIPEIQVKYIAPLVSGNDVAYKVGVEFFGVDLSTDQKIAKLINDSIRELESDFEELV